MRKVCLPKLGFTLVETLVAVGFVAVMTGLIVPRFASANRLQRVVGVRDVIKLVYIQARDNALSGRNPCATGVGFLGWRVIVTGSMGSGYTITPAAVCSNNSYPNANFVAGTIVNLPANYVTLNISGPGGTDLGNGILFRSGGEGIYPPINSTSSIRISIQDSNGNNRFFDISGFGNIQ